MAIRQEEEWLELPMQERCVKAGEKVYKEAPILGPVRNGLV
jgi:hypothetical protein